MARALLTVHEMVVFARSRGILCQGRGSAANSTVCYVLGITAVDPSKHDPLFERFVSASRNEPPDIDFDLEHERREKVILGTVIRHRERSTIREVGKALGLSEDMTGRLAKGSGDRVATVAWTNWRRRKGWISPIAGSILHWNWRRRSRTSHVIWRPTSATSS
jgi:DNA polymerase III alpha subunit